MSDSPLFLLLIVPFVGGLVAGLTSRWERATAVFGVLFLLLQTWLVYRLPVADSWFILGREMVFHEGIRLLYLLLCLEIAGLFLLSIFLPVGAGFVPGGLAALSPMAIALMIRPLAFNVLALALMSAFLVTVIQTGRAGYTRGALRYLVMVVLAIPLLLLASWMLETDQQVLFAAVSRLLAVGFILLLAGFPFHLWVMPVLTETSPLASAFLVGPVQLCVTVILLQVMSDYPHLWQDETFLQPFRWSGVGTAVLAGLITLSAQEPRRLWGGLVLLDMGMGLLALASGSRETAVWLTFTRFLSLLMAGVGFGLFNRWRNGINSFYALLSTTLFGYGCVSLLGLPFTLGFNGRWAVLTAVAAQSPWLSLLLILAIAASGYSLFRIMTVLFDAPVSAETVAITNSQ